MRSRYFLVVLTFLAFVLLYPSHQALAAQCTGAYGFPDPFCGASIPQIVNRLVTAVLSVAGGIFFVMFLWGGVSYMTAAGDAKKVAGARTVLTNAIIGLGIIALSYTLVVTVINIVSGTK